jgi:translocation and assembly module TamB
MKWLKRALIVTLTLAVVAALGGASLLWLVGSERGTRWLVARLLAATPELTIARQSGSLREGLVLEGVAWRSARDELDIDSLALDWDAAAALAGTLAFDHADASRASYRRLATAANAESSAAPELPWPLRIDEASIATLTITVAERTLPLDTIRFTGTLADGLLTLEDVTARSSTADLAAHGTVVLRTVVELETTIEWSAPLGDVAAHGILTLAGTWPALRVHHELTAPFAAVTDGVLVFGGTAPTAELRTTWRELAWPGLATVASPSGELELAGSLDAYRYDAMGAVVVAGRNASFTAGGTGAQLELELERFTLAADADRAALQATGTVSLAARETRLAVTAEDFDPAWLDARWPGRLSGTAALHAALAPTATAEVDDVALAGELRGYPVTIGGAATFTAPGRVGLASLRFESAANHVALTGTFDADNVDLAVDAELTNLDLLVPGARGAVSAVGTLSGTWREPQARGRIAARELAFAGFTLAEVDVSGEAGLAPTASLAVTIEAAGGARGPVTVEGVSAVVTGTTDAHTVTVAATAADWDATLEANGGADTGGAWRGVVTSLEIDEHVLGPWRLEQPAALTLAPRAATLANACLLHASRARWCAELDVQGRSEDRIAVAGQNFDLATLAPLLPPGIELNGVYQLSASLFDVLGDPRGALAVTGETTHAHIALEGAEAFDADLGEARLGLTLTAGRLELQAHVASTNGGEADLQAEIADVRADDSAIDGTLRAQWPDLRFLTLLSPDLEEVAGALAVDLGVTGSVAEPRVSGRAVISDGHFTVPRWGLIVTDVEATAMSGDGSSLEWNATGRAGDGMLTLNGTTTLAAAAGWPTHFTLRGENVALVQLPEAQIIANPNLDIDVALPRVTVAGSVHVPRAAIEVEALPTQAVAPSPDAFVHGQTTAQRAEPLRVSANIDFTLGDDVRYAGLGLDTMVAGELSLTTEPGRSTTASGALTLAGTYNAYGQRLDLERGRLLFSGPLDDPGLDVRAVRTIDTTQVGVELTGTVRSPRTRVVATPAMSEVDALSYLLFGRPASGANASTGAGETSTLQTAALALGLQQALPVVQRLGTTLGLDELFVQTAATDSGELMAGKYLSPKVYIRYSYGLFNRIGGLLLRFKVNERLSIETRSGEQKSMDLLYTVEKD